MAVKKKATPKKKAAKAAKKAPRAAKKTAPAPKKAAKKAAPESKSKPVAAAKAPAPKAQALKAPAFEASALGKGTPLSQSATDKKVSDIMARLKHTGRNEPCPCGSGKKYKKCHLHEDEVVEYQVLHRLSEAITRRLKDKHDQIVAQAKKDGRDLPELHPGFHEIPAPHVPPSQRVPKPSGAAAVNPEAINRRISAA